jgi:hypothetical protein
MFPPAVDTPAPVYNIILAMSEKKPAAKNQIQKQPQQKKRPSSKTL